MTRVPPKPVPLLAASGTAVAVLRDHVVVWLDVATGEVTSVRAPFAARRAAIAPGGRLVAVAGEGQLSIADFGEGGELVGHRALPLEAVDRIDVDDAGVVVLSSAADAAVARVIPDGDVTSVAVPPGFHESLVLVPAADGAPVAHLVISGDSTRSAIAAFDHGELVDVWEPAPQGAARAGDLLAVHTLDALRLFSVDAAGHATPAGETTLEGVERVAPAADGTALVTVAATWNGREDVLRLERLDLPSLDRHELDAAGVDRGDALTWAGGVLVRAWGASGPARIEAQPAGGPPVVADVDAEVAAARR